jgi:hypothetical protein
MNKHKTFLIAVFSLGILFSVLLVSGAYYKNRKDQIFSSINFETQGDRAEEANNTFLEVTGSVVDGRLSTDIDVILEQIDKELITQEVDEVFTGFSDNELE